MPSLDSGVGEREENKHETSNHKLAWEQPRLYLTHLENFINLPNSSSKNKES